ncbi:MAG TPA: adenosylcobinamide-GDP ribazoletransferase [Roseiflexaceae bacterium]|nr:adenosylcobinamide-GDP ribazoletransferase [Roseiflexaceae bacterium]
MRESTEQPSARNWWGPLWPLGEALRFLTIIPIPGMPSMSEQSIARAIPLFPLAGAVIGALLIGLGIACGALWDAWVRAVAIVVGWGILTAGLHLDGLSDTFDAVMSWRTRERKLEIMRDSRIGAMGALALIAVLALKATWLHAAGDGWWRAVWLAPILGRWADTYGIFRFPPAREGGLGREFQARARRGDFVIATATAAGLALILAGSRGLLALALVWCVSNALARWWTRDLGGLTGDTYGALCEIAEVVTLAVLSAGF